MKIESAEVMSFVYDILAFEDEVDANGQRVRRTMFPKDHWRGAKVFKDQCEACIEVQCSKGEEVTVLKFTDIQKDRSLIDGMKVQFEAFVVREPIEVSPSGLAAFKFFYSKREQLPLASVEVMDVVDKLIGE